MGETMVSLISQVLSCYGACFGHALRQPIMKELQQALILSGRIAVRSVGGFDSNSNRMLRSTKTFHLEVHY